MSWLNSHRKTVIGHTHIICYSNNDSGELHWTGSNLWGSVNYCDYVIQMVYCRHTWYGHGFAPFSMQIHSIQHGYTAGRIFPHCTWTWTHRNLSQVYPYWTVISQYQTKPTVSMVLAVFRSLKNNFIDKYIYKNLYYC